MSSQLEFNYCPDLLIRAQESPTVPGCYLMQSANKTILYVGKAKSLKNRLTSYFQNPSQLSPRIGWLVSQIRSFELILTESETEALVLEATLIKKYRPKFNIRLKDDKSYPIITVDLSKKVPQLQWARSHAQGLHFDPDPSDLKKKAKLLQFGPFPSALAAKNTLKFLNQTFKLRDCSDNTFRHRTRPCVLFEMNHCCGPCVFEVPDYLKKFDQIKTIFEGNSEFMADLKYQMLEKAQNDEFEQAAFLRDRIHDLDLITQTQSVVLPHCDENIDILALSMKETLTTATVVKVIQGKVHQLFSYRLGGLQNQTHASEILDELITQIYALNEENRPDQLWVPFDFGQRKELSESLSINILDFQTLACLEQNASNLKLIQFAQSNADFALSRMLQESHGHSFAALEETQRLLGLSQIPHRIECYDISHFQGDQTVGSRVVFIDGQPEKSLYRRYKLQNPQKQNDFANLQEVISRRLKSGLQIRSEKQSKLQTDAETFPDLIIIDGGKIQLQEVRKAMAALGCEHIPTIGLAKSRVESNFQSQELESSAERIFTIESQEPIELDLYSLSFKLLTHLRDEAHRFALNYNRLLRSKARS